MRALTLRDLEELGWRRFEDLVAAIVLNENPGAEQLGGKDGGADTLLERRAEGAKVWQSKHFSRDIHWGQCVESLDAAVKNYSPTEVVFAFPRNMSRPVKKTFKQRLGGRYPDVEVSYMSGSQIIAEMRQRGDDFIEEFLGPDPRDQAAQVAQHLAAGGLQVARRPEADKISRHFELADEAGRRDRYFRTEVAVTTGEAPIPEWAEKPTLLMTGTQSDRNLRIAAWPEKGTSGKLLDLWFEDSKEGWQARWEVAQMLASSGKAALPKGATARLNKLPEAVTAISGGVTGILDDVTLTSLQSHRVKLVGEHAGERLEREMELVAVPPLEAPTSDAEAATFGCVDGELSLFLNFSLSPERVAISIHLSFNLLDTANLSGAVEALRLLVALNQGGGQIEAPSLTPEGSIPLSPEEKSQERIERNRSALLFFENLIVIRDALDLDGFQIGAEVTEDESKAALIAAHAIQTHTGYYTAVEFGVEVPIEEVVELERSGYDPVVARFPATIEILGEELYLGVGEAELPKPSDVQVLEASDPSKQRVELKWSKPPSVPFKLVSELGSISPETGLWAPGRVPTWP